MSTLLIKLNGAPEDEVLELRQLLTDHAIDFYETDTGRWGTSVAALWLRDEAQLEQARRLIDDYQQERTTRIRAEVEAQRLAGNHDTLQRRLMAEPIKMGLYLALICAVICLSVVPFLGLI